MQNDNTGPKDGDYIREIERLEALQQLSQAADVRRDADREAVRMAARPSNKTPAASLLEAMQAASKAGQVADVKQLAKSPRIWIAAIVVVPLLAWFVSGSGQTAFIFLMLAIAGLASSAIRVIRQK